MGTVKKSKEEVTTIQVSKSLARKLQTLAKEWGDTYDTIIWRLLNENKGDAHEDRGDKGNEPTGISD